MTRALSKLKFLSAPTATPSQFMLVACSYNYQKLGLDYNLNKRKKMLEKKSEEEKQKFASTLSLENGNEPQVPNSLWYCGRYC